MTWKTACAMLALLAIPALAGPAPEAIQQGGTQARHAAKCAAAKAHAYELLMIGDSITHTLDQFGGKYAGLTNVWNRRFVPRDALNLAYSGARTENILWNLQNGELEGQSPKLAVLLIGTNDADDRHFKVVRTPEEIVAGTRAIVDVIRAKCPAARILILRIFPRGGDDEKSISPPPFNSSARCIETVRRAGELTRALADDHSVFWLDVNAVFLRPDGTINTDLMPDLLHPNEAGAEAWTKAIEPTIDRLMGRAGGGS